MFLSIHSGLALSISLSHLSSLSLKYSNTSKLLSIPSCPHSLPLLLFLSLNSSSFYSMQSSSLIPVRKHQIYSQFIPKIATCMPLSTPHSPCSFPIPLHHSARLLLPHLGQECQRRTLINGQYVPVTFTLPGAEVCQVYATLIIV